MSDDIPPATPAERAASEAERLEAPTLPGLAPLPGDASAEQEVVRLRALLEQVLEEVQALRALLE